MAWRFFWRHRQALKSGELNMSFYGALITSTLFSSQKFSSQEVTLSAFDAAILKARSDATKTTLSLLAIVMLIVKLFL